MSFLYPLNIEGSIYLFMFFAQHGTGRFTWWLDKNQQHEAFGFRLKSNHKSSCSVFPLYNTALLTENRLCISHVLLPLYLQIQSTNV